MQYNLLSNAVLKLYQKEAYQYMLIRKKIYNKQEKKYISLTKPKHIHLCQ